MFFIFIFDSLIVGSIIFYLVKALLGENALSRFLRIVLSFSAATLYFYKTLSYSINGSSMNLFVALSFGPIILIVLLSFLDYLFKSTN